MKNIYKYIMKYLFFHLSKMFKTMNIHFNDRVNRIINNYVKTGFSGKEPDTWVYFNTTKKYVIFICYQTEINQRR